MITFVFIVYRLAELLQNFSRNPSRLSKAATTSYPRCGDVSGPVMASRFCSPYWWWKRHWLMQIVFVLWLVKRYVVYRGATRLDKSLENYSCLTAASYKVSIALRSAFFTLVQPCILYNWACPWARWSESCVLIDTWALIRLGYHAFISRKIKGCVAKTYKVCNV